MFESRPGARGMRKIETQLSREGLDIKLGLSR